MVVATRARARLLAIVLVLGLGIGVLPAPLSAQEPVTRAVTDAFSGSGDVGDADLDFAWTITSAQAPWRVEVSGVPDETVRVRLLDADGAILTESSAPSSAALRDLRLDSGAYTVRVTRTGADAFPVQVVAEPEPAVFDPEPNDTAATATRIADGETISGRLARPSARQDTYRLTVPAGEAAVRDVELAWDGEIDRELCLFDADEVVLQCRTGTEGTALPSLVLPPDDYFLRVRGTHDDTLPYRLSISLPRPRDPAEEAEPNDSELTASRFDAALGVKAVSSRADEDFHEVAITGEPQLWRIEADGAPVTELEWVRNRRIVAASRPSCREGEPAAIDDLYLVPGRHRFSIRTCADEPVTAGAYELRLVPLGQRDPEAEREPNGDEERAEPYRLGERKVGRLTTVDDQDHYRFSLSTPTSLQLTLEQPPGADLDLRLWTGGLEVLRERADDSSDRLDVPLQLAAGDYRIQLTPRVPADGEYVLRTQLIDPLDAPVDVEPNGYPGLARDVPATLRWSGDRSGIDQDTDGYWLPPLSQPGPATITIRGERPWARLFADAARAARIPLEEPEPGVFVAMEAPLGQRLYLEMSSDGAYEVELEAPGWVAADDPEELPLALDLAFETDTVAAYWTEGQRLIGSLRLEHQGDAPRAVTLAAEADHPSWRPALAASQLTLEAGETADVDLTLDVAPDMWAREPVSVRVVATADDGAAVATSTRLQATPDAPAVGSRQAWLVPEEMLGGLNVAGAAVGGVPGGLTREDREIELFDDLTPPGRGYGEDIDEIPLEVSVDLAGDEAIPVVGTILNPLSRRLRHDHMVREFELLLSTDGRTWTSVLRDELDPVPIDQYYVLEEPLDATHAKLAIHSTYGRGDSRFAGLGEWKVIARPGVSPVDAPVNIADPLRGGHLARSLPNIGNWAEERRLLDEDLKRGTRSLPRAGIGSDRVEFVLAFQDGRAAQITQLRWTDPDGSVEGERLEAVEVDVSLDGPLGPWTTVGTWDLRRAADGSVAPFDLPDGTWARYVRVGADVDTEVLRRVELPGRLEVDERATDDDYRSILGEWGYTRSVGPYEWLVPSALPADFQVADAGDTRETATPLELGEPRTETAEILEDVDWFEVVVPPGANTLELTLTGVPSVGVGLDLYDQAGAIVPLELVELPDGVVRYRGPSAPGTYHAEVTQPPFNVAFTFDTSGSMGPYLDFVFEGMREFAADVRPGRELVTILPFDEATLLPGWTDQPAALEAAVNAYEPVKESSDVWSGIDSSAAMLSRREGTRAILVVADAQTGTGDAQDVWANLDDVQPVIYTVHVGADGEPEETRNVMRAFADSNGGVYTYPTTHAEMNRAFERLSTQLRRPSLYTLEAASQFVDRRPATLSVVAPEAAPPALAPSIGVGLVLDTSGSMRAKLGGKRRIAIARSSLQRLVSEGLAEGVPLTLRTFTTTGTKRSERCATEATLPLEPLDRRAAVKAIKGLTAAKRTRTPIADALRATAEDLSDLETRSIVIVTDGDETCGGDPAAVIAELRAAGIDINLNIVGFALEDEELKAKMAAWAEAGGGSYFDAEGAAELAGAIATAVSAPYRVFAPDGEEPLASGVVGGEGVQLDPGSYRVEVLTEPLVRFDEVVLAGGERLTLDLPLAEE